MLAGAVLGFGGWVVMTFVLIIVTGNIDAGYGQSGTILTGWLIAVFLGAVALIVWPRTRRLGQGLLLGTAIGLVVAGGLCIPLMVGTV